MRPRTCRALVKPYERSDARTHKVAAFHQHNIAQYDAIGFKQTFQRARRSDAKPYPARIRSPFFESGSLAEKRHCRCQNLDGHSRGQRGMAIIVE